MADESEKSAVGAWFASLGESAKNELAKRALDHLANGLVDDLEEALLGKKGAADEILAKEGAEESAIDKLRREARGQAPGPTPPQSSPAPPTKTKTGPPTAAEREAKARAELAELKKKMGKG